MITHLTLVHMPSAKAHVPDIRLIVDALHSSLAHSAISAPHPGPITCDTEATCGVSIHHHVIADRTPSTLQYWQQLGVLQLQLAGAR
jgi:hypothetical protein